MSFATVISADDAAALIGDGSVVTVSSASALGCPDAVLAAIGRRFAKDGAPRRITAVHPIAAGDMYGIKGVEHLAQPGLLARILAGSLPSGASSLPLPNVWRMIAIAFSPICGRASSTSSGVPLSTASGASSLNTQP